jgi:hypothetical protein
MFHYSKAVSPGVLCGTGQIFAQYFGFPVSNTPPLLHTQMPLVYLYFVKRAVFHLNYFIQFFYKTQI